MVSRTLGPTTGSCFFIGKLDDYTYLKYNHNKKNNNDDDDDDDDDDENNGD